MKEFKSFYKEVTGNEGGKGGQLQQGGLLQSQKARRNVNEIILKGCRVVHNGNG